MPALLGREGRLLLPGRSEVQDEVRDIRLQRRRQPRRGLPWPVAFALQELTAAEEGDSRARAESRELDPDVRRRRRALAGAGRFRGRWPGAARRSRTSGTWAARSCDRGRIAGLDPGRGDRTYPFNATASTTTDRPAAAGGVLASIRPRGGSISSFRHARGAALGGGRRGRPPGTIPIEELPGGSPAAPAARSPCSASRSRRRLRATTSSRPRLRRGLNKSAAKDELELARMRHAERATAAGFAALVELIEPGAASGSSRSSSRRSSSGTGRMAWRSTRSSAAARTPPSCTPADTPEARGRRAGARRRRWRVPRLRERHHRTYPSRGSSPPSNAHSSRSSSARARRPPNAACRERSSGTSIATRSS